MLPGAQWFTTQTIMRIPLVEVPSLIPDWALLRRNKCICIYISLSGAGAKGAALRGGCPTYKALRLFVLQTAYAQNKYQPRNGNFIAGFVNSPGC